MKLIIAVLRPSRLEDVRNAVIAMGLQGMTASIAEDYDCETRHIELDFRGRACLGESQVRARVEVAVCDAEVEQVIEAICNVARTGRRGDGYILVAELPRMVRIRTGECAELELEALAS